MTTPLLLDPPNYFWVSLALVLLLRAAAHALVGVRDVHAFGSAFMMARKITSHWAGLSEEQKSHVAHLQQLASDAHQHQAITTMEQVRQVFAKDHEDEDSDASGGYA